MSDSSARQYQDYRKPSWAPPSWVFGPVWTMLYVIIAVSFGYVVYACLAGRIPLQVLVPFAINLLANLLFTFIQFGLKRHRLALLDVVLVWASLVWVWVTIFPYAPWVVYVTIPYLAWTSFACCLQAAVVRLNT